MPSCPKCSSQSARKSRKALKNRQSQSRLKAAFRCDNCGTRFVAFDPLQIGLYSISAVFAFLFIGILWNALSESTPEESSKGFRSSDGSTSSAMPATTENSITFNRDDLAASAEGGDPDAQYRLAMALFREHKLSGNARTQADAFANLRLAADNGHPRAQGEMGNLYFEGRGVVQDFVQARDWYQKAANQGDSQAMYGLGTMSRSGWGEDVSLIDAYVWLNLASARGEAAAQQARREVMSRLSAEQLSDAQQKSRDLDEVIP